MTQENNEQVFAPTTEEEASQFFEEASRRGQKVRLKGAGTKQDLGNLPTLTNLTISTLKLNRLIDYTPEDLTITVGAGMPFDEVQEILGQHGQFLPLDPLDLSGQTIGGILATNRSGPRRLLYGTARDLLIGCRFVLADGTIAHSGGKVVKNVAGYDLHKLFIGSYGTLGLLTEVTFKVVPKPQVIGTTTATFETTQAAFLAARQCVRSNLMPAALELLNSPDATSNPKYKLYIGAEGMEVAVKDQLAKLGEICKATGAQSVEITDKPSVWYELTNVTKKFKVELRVGTVLTNLPRAYNLLEEALAQLDVSGTLQARAGTGLVYLATELEEKHHQQMASLIEKIRAEIAQDGGTLVIEKAPNELKHLVEVWGDMGDALASMQALKAKFDPQGLLNPGTMDLAVARL